MRGNEAPHSAESECAVLGSLLLTGGHCFDKVADLLADSDFYFRSHQVLYRIAGTLVQTGQPADLVTVTARLEALGVLKQAGGREYLEEIVRATPSAANVRKYAEVIVERRMKRQLIDASRRMEELAYEPGDVRQQMDAAQSLVMHLTEGSTVDDEPKSMSEVVRGTLEWIDERHSADSPLTGRSWGFKGLDDKTSGLQDGDLVIVAGRPAMGKSVMAQNLAENVSMGVTSLVDANGAPIIVDGCPVLVFSLEMSNLQLGLRSLSSAGKVDLNLLRSPTRMQNAEDWAKLTVAVERLHNSKLFIDETPGISISKMHAKARRFQRKHGLGLIIVDYLQLMSGSESAARRGRVEELSEITRGLKAMARDLGVPVVALSQLSRKVEERANKRPLMSDLRESGSIEQDADVVIFMYRDDYYNPDSQFRGIAEAIIGKQRMGETGTVGLQFVGSQAHFKDFAGRLPADDSETTASRPPQGSRGGFTFRPND
ncbi:replicative DNA helicase (plasmid) [Burkholderia vietnamiensis]|uniref:Replicative DNA helicase n=1 Tax=Burkholderia vietnamiensis (strain G4 / LMG 22486) TaxID=269482 RepID=A4JTR1_BURVG|nr:primary replicative DNA helicase [Burkholderia vietnamiensis G4]MCB4350177.1 replicative DNA helicase [Burkholderia vietnamiensis]